ncbi:DUF6148 family protein [Acidaminococcus fermentans]|uniref:DUF6148 family protein n=1 Tax=Acidaminococcus fermentans TaxID=905 RepID=UPI000D1063A5|nr:DUF6148 family protein [Acidaminococcus fermentans]
MAETQNDRLKQYLAAEQAILEGGQSYKIGNRMLTRADLAEIRKEINSLIAAGASVDGVSSRTCRSKRVIMRD